MTRLEIVCLSEVRARMVQSLQLRGLLHLEDVPTEQTAAPGFLGRVQLEGKELEEYTRLEDVDRKLNEAAPLLTEKPDEGEIKAAFKAVRGWDEATRNANASTWTERLREFARTRSALQDQLAVLQNYKQILEDVKPALGGGDVKLGKGTRAVVLTGNVKKALRRLDERFQEEVGPGLKFHRQVERKRLVGLVTYPEQQDDTVGRILSQEGVTAVDMRDEAYANASIGEVITKIESTIQKQQAALAETNAGLAKFSREIGAELLAQKAIISDGLSQMRAQNQFAESEMVTVIHGWTPTEFLTDLEKALDRDFHGQAVLSVLSQEGLHGPEIPTLLKNHRWIKPFEVVMGLFRPPTYGTIDPTLLVAISFIFFYGFVLGDVGYGLVIFLLARWAGKKFGHKHAAIGAAVTIGRYMGIAGIVFGVLYGEYFGNFGEKLFHSMGLTLPMLFHRAHYKMQLLVLAIMIGAVHVPLALILGIRESLRHHHTKHAIEKFGLLLGLFALIIISCSYFEVYPFSETAFLYAAGGMLAVAVILLFVSMGAMGAIGVLEILSLGSNVLSYARLMALGVVAISLADIANDLPASMGWFIGVPFALFIHAINIFLSIAEPAIHSLRLNFVEFLPKFYSPEGKSFNPFKKEIQW